MAFHRTRMTVLCAILAASSPAMSQEGDSMTRDEIVKASKSHPAAGRASADFQATESQKAAQRLIDQLEKAEAEDEDNKKTTSPPGRAPATPKPAYEITNDLQDRTAVPEQAKPVFEPARNDAHKAIKSFNE